MPRGKKATGAPKATPHAPKTTTTEHSRPGSAELSDAERQGLFVQSVRDIEKAKKVQAEATATLRDEYKRAKSYGFAKARIEAAIAFKKLAPEQIQADLKTSLETDLETLRWLAIPVGTQAELFSTPDRTPSVEKAAAAGRVAGLEGSDASPPYPAGSAQGQAWLNAWHEGQAFNASKIKQAPIPDDFDEFAPPAPADPSEGVPAAH